jgi:hypothetical protein
MHKQIANNPELDPTLPKVELELDGKTYFLCFTFAALAHTEASLRKLGVTVNMLQALDFETLDATKLSAMLYAAMLTHDNSVTPDFASSLIHFRNIGKIREALLYALVASIADPTKEAESDPLVQPE